MTCKNNFEGIYFNMQKENEQKKTSNKCNTPNKKEKAEIILQERLAELGENKNSISSIENVLTEEIDIRVDTEENLKQRQVALEEVYTIATCSTISIKYLCNKIIESLAKLFQAYSISICLKETNTFKPITQYLNGKILNTITAKNNKCDLCIHVSKKKELYIINKDLHDTHFHLVCDKHNRFVSGACVPIINHTNEILGIICLFNMTQNSFIKDNLNLVEIFATYLAHELTQKNMGKKLRDAEEIKKLGRLTSGVAHEVRNPLNAIMAIIEALFEDSGENPEYESYLVLLKNQVTKLSSLMEDLLTLGKPVETNRLSTISVSSIISISFDSWKESTQYKNRKVKILNNPDTNDAVLKIDSIKIQQVLHNLIENACHHSPQKSIVLIKTKKNFDDSISVFVIDKGRGISKKNISHIFEPFFSTRNKGTGLGLSIVKHIMEIHGGSVIISNTTPPPGVTAEIIFPIKLIA